MGVGLGVGLGVVGAVVELGAAVVFAMFVMAEKTSTAGTVTGVANASSRCGGKYGSGVSSLPSDRPDGIANLRSPRAGAEPS